MASLQAIYTYPLKSAAGSAEAQVKVEPWGLARDRRWMLVDPSGRFITGRAIGELVRLRAQAQDDGLLLHWHDGTQCLARVDPAAELISVTVWKDQVPAQPTTPLVDDWLSERLRRPLRLVHLADPRARPFRADRVDGTASESVEGVVSLADGLPLLAVGSGSLSQLSEWVGETLDLRRFRPNLVIAGLPPFAEDRWRLLRIGGVGLRMVRPCVRCIFTTVDPDSGVRHPRREPLATLERMRMLPRGACFGVNLLPWPAAGNEDRLRVGDPVEVLSSG